MVKKKVSLLEFSNNPNIGLFMVVNDKFALCGKELEESKRLSIENILGVKVFNMTAQGTDLLGVFFAMDNENIIVPDLQDYELKRLKEIAKDFNMKILQYKETINTFGNSICIGKNHILIDGDCKLAFRNKLKKDLGKELVIVRNPIYKNMGALSIYLNEKYFISQDLTENDVKPMMGEIAGIGSINSGSAYISSGAVGNSNGLLIGSNSTSIEIQNIVEGLDYL